MRIDPDLERSVVNQLHHLLTHGAGDLPSSVEKLIDDAESLIVSLLRQRSLVRHSLMDVLEHAHHDRVTDHSDRIYYRRAQQLLLDIPANSPCTDEFAGAARTIRKSTVE